MAQPAPEHPRKPKKPKSLPRKRARAKEEPEEKLEELGDADIIEVETAGQTMERMQQEKAERAEREARTADDLSKRIADLKRQKEVNAANTGLNDAMAKKINAEIDRNIAELTRAADESEGVYTSAPRMERAAASDEAPKAPLEPRKPGEAPRTYAEHKEDLEKVLTHLEKAGTKAEEAPESVDVDLTELNADAENKEREKQIRVDKVISKLEEEGFFRLDKDERRKKEREMIQAATTDWPADVGEGKEMRDLLTMEIIDRLKEKERHDKMGQEERVEDDFFRKGEAMDRMHAAGEAPAARSAAERAGDAGEERHAMAERAETLRRQVAGMEQQMARAEKLLGDHGIKDADEAMAKRATGGFMAKAKGFLGGLFSRKARETEHAMDLYASIRDQYNEKKMELNELDNRLKNPEGFRQAMQLKAERKKP